MRSAFSALVVQTFWPLTTQWSPASTARVVMRGEVGAGARLGEALAPDDLVVQHRLDDLGLLLVGADGHHRGAEEGQAQRVDGQRGVATAPSPRRRSPSATGCRRGRRTPSARRFRRSRHGPSAPPTPGAGRRTRRRQVLPEVGVAPLIGRLASSQARNSVRKAASSALSLRSTALQPSRMDRPRSRLELGWHRTTGLYPGQSHARTSETSS